MPNRSSHWGVFEFGASRHVPQQEAAPAHVTTSDEVDRKAEVLAEDPEQDVDVLRGGDAAEQDNRDIADRLMQRLRTLLEREAIQLVCRVDLRGRKGPDRLGGDTGVRTAESGVRRDDVDTGADQFGSVAGHLGESPRIGELAAKVEAADEGEQVAERHAAWRPQPLGHVEARLRRKRLLRAAPAAIGGRQQEDAPGARG